MTPLGSAFLAFKAFAAGVCAAGERITLKVEGAAGVSIEQPEGWRHQSQPSSPIGQTVRMTSASGKTVLLVTAMPGKAPDSALDKFIELANGQYTPGFGGRAMGADHAQVGEWRRRLWTAQLSVDTHWSVSA